MSTRGNNPDPQASRGAARPAAPASGGMVMLAGSAAGRMVEAVLARLAGPYAGPAARPLRPAVLWQHVARRLGYTPPGSTPLGTASSATPPRPPAVDLVWRVRPVTPPQDERVEEAAPYLAPRAFSFARPVSPVPTASPPAPALPTSSAAPVPGPPPAAARPPSSVPAMPPGGINTAPPATPPVQHFVAPVPASSTFLVSAPAPSAPVQRVPLWEQVTRTPVTPARPAPPIALARQVAYRMGQDAALPATPGFTVLGPVPVPETPLVWRTRPVAPPPAADAVPPAPPARPRVSLPPPAAVPPTPAAGSAASPGAAPAPAAPVQRMPAAPVSSAAPGAPAPSA